MELRTNTYMNMPLEVGYTTNHGQDWSHGGKRLAYRFTLLGGELQISD